MGSASPPCRRRDAASTSPRTTESCSSSAVTWCSPVGAVTRSTRTTMRSSNSQARRHAATDEMLINHENTKTSKITKIAYGFSCPSRFSCASWLLFLMVTGVCTPALAQYEAPPFDSIHLAVPEVSQARDWYLKYIGGNLGETADRNGFGKWTGDHPLPIPLIFDVSANALPSA